MKAMRKKGKLNIYIIILIIIVIISVTFLLLRKDNKFIIREEKQASYNIAKGEFILQTDNNITIVPEDLNKNIYVENYKIEIDFKNLDVTKNEYKIEYGANGILKKEDLKQNNWLIYIDLNEGENNIIVNIKNNNNYICKWENTIFYIKPYQKQYLDELEENGYSTHFGYPWNPDSVSQVGLLKNLGINCIRDDIRWNLIEKENGKYDYSRYDKWINEVCKNNIDIIGILGFPDQLIGSDKKLSSQEEVDKFLRFAEDVISRYNGKIMYYEFWNEPNTILLTDEDMKWYSEAVKGLNSIINRINPEIELTIGALRTDGINTDSFNTSDNIIKGFYNNNLDKYSSNISLHIYQYKGKNINSYYKTVLKKHNQILNDFGGFENVLITEQGASTYKEGVDEERQSSIFISQSIMDDKLGIKSEYKYSYRDLQSTNSSDKEAKYNFGSVKDDYTPKKSYYYYAMKNYYENTNGAEYIGMVNLAEGLEAYVYDKDGKPKIIAWSDNSDSIISIDYLGFTAKDIYGNDIENTNGKLEVSTSPVYLDNVSTKYFYEAISNTALKKYTEFEEKFVTEIGSVPGLQEQMDILKQYMGSISNVSSVDENIAKEEMQKHFHLGNLILEAYKNGNLNVEYVKLSSMLDMLNDIGDSYEDLVTVSSITKNPDIQGTKSLIDSTEQEINLNSDIEVVYPTKILEFSKELYEKSDYINNLKEENAIKTGLIVSYDLHAKYLADWANTFTNIYIDDYIENNPITESYSETNLTNKDVIVTLNIGKDAKVTNNEGKNTYTFVNNGKFTFEYERRGRTFSKEVIVENIDKTSPVVSGVENGKTYSKSVNPEITDEHLEEVELKLNGQVVEGFASGNEIREEGIYELIARDKANNETRVGFEIKYKLEPESEEYSIDGQYILGVRNNTTLEKFIEILNGNVGYTIYRNEAVLQKEDIVATGDTLVTEYGKTFYIIVKGDITKDGITNIKDLVQIRRKILGLEKFDELQLKAADMFSDEVINIKDLVRIRRIILGIE